MEDTYSVMLKKVIDRKDREQGLNEERKITFDDYEAFLDRLDKEGKLQDLESKNPKARYDKLEQEW